MSFLTTNRFFREINKGFLLYVIILNVLFMVLRITLGISSEDYSGNIVTSILYVMVLFTLLYFLFKRNIDYFLMTWIGTYYALTYIKIPIYGLGNGFRLFDFVLIAAVILFTNKRFNKYILTILIFSVYAIVNVSSAQISLVLAQFLKLLTPLLLLYLAYIKSKNRQLILDFVIFIALITLPLTIYEILFQPEWGIFLDWRGFRVFGNMFWPNYYSVFLLPSIVLLYSKLRRRFSLMVFLGFLILLIADIFTFSRAGLISLFVALFIFEFFYRTSFNHIAKKVVFLSILFIAVFFYLTTNISDEHLNEDALSERTNIWNTILPDIQNNLIVGNGLGSYLPSRENVNEWMVSSHNQYLEILFELGIIGLIIIIVFMFYLIYDAIIKIKSFKYGQSSAQLLLALTVALLFYSFFGNSAFDQVQASNWWIVMGCLLALCNEEGINEHKKK